MKKTLLSLACFGMGLALLPGTALAHGHTSFEINGKIYSFVVGSLNEPVAVDDKTGVDMRVSSISLEAREAAKASGKEAAGTPVTGLESTLKVELTAGGKRKTIDIRPAYGAPGAYTAPFTPTIQTTYGYRVFGTIDDTLFDYTFECNPAGHPQVQQDNTPVEVSSGVTRIEKSGSFGCPTAKAELGFPEPSASIYDINARIQNLQSSADNANTAANGSRSFGLGGIGLSVVALAIAAAGLRKKSAV